MVMKQSEKKIILWNDMTPKTTQKMGISSILHHLEHFRIATTGGHIFFAHDKMKLRKKIMLAQTELMLVLVVLVLPPRWWHTEKTWERRAWEKIADAVCGDECVYGINNVDKKNRFFFFFKICDYTLDSSTVCTVHSYSHSQWINEGTRVPGCKRSEYKIWSVFTTTHCHSSD